MTLLDLPGMAERLLDTVASVAAAEGVDLPGRAYVTADGLVGEAWDCEQVTVNLLSLGPALAVTPGERAVPLGYTVPGAVGPPSAVLRVSIVRAVPTLSDMGDPPAAAEIHAAGLALLRDVALLRAVQVALVTPGAAQIDGVGGDLRLLAIVPQGTEGGFAGVAGDVAVTVYQ